MLSFATTCEAVAATTKKTEKVRLVAEYFHLRTADEAAQAAVFLSGRVFPAWEERTLQTGGAVLWRALAKVSGKSEAELSAAYRRYGDAGSAAFDVLKDVAPAESSLSVSGLARVFDELAHTSITARKLAILEELLRQTTPLESKYIVKIISGDLRIGLRESLVEEAIAQTYDQPLNAVQRANMMLGDIGETLRLAAKHSLDHARMRLFHPVGFMLASSAENAEEAFEYFAHAAVEDKYDGIRAQAHCGGAGEPRVTLFSRTLDEISQSFPEIPPALRAFSVPVILDGEILAWSASASQALPFSELQKRLGRKKVPQHLIRDVPVVYMVFDVLYADGELVIEKPLAERKKILDRLFASLPPDAFITGHAVAMQDFQGQLVFEWVGEPAVAASSGPPRVIIAPMATANSARHLDELFAAARDHGNEGLMVKDLSSPYTLGRRGKSWLKLKRELATLDVVVTAVEWGHGKRAKVLSDYTFAIRDGDRLLNVGKAYSGLTDVEIARMTQWFLAHTIEDQGFRRTVEPKIVVEVAFNNMMRSERHASGYALRFPRILRLRGDKTADDIDTLETLREVYEKQLHTKKQRAS